MAEESSETKGTNNLDKELSNLYQPKAAVPKRAAVRAPRARKAAAGPSRKKAVIAKGKRKRAIARATLRAGRGEIRINGMDVNLVKPKEVRDLILEPIKVSSLAKTLADVSKIDVNVYGGGRSGQAQATRSAIAKVIASASPNDAIRKIYMEYDRTLLVDDYRRVEPKKFLGTKARARFQKSYR